MRLENKVAIITGASSGIGEGIAKRFIQEGAKVVGCGIEEKLGFEDSNVTYVQANLTNYEEAEKVVAEAVKAFGKVDIVVNCAGVTGVGSLETTTTEEFQRQFSINVNGVFHMCKAAIGELKKQKGAAIVNIGSDLGVRPIPERISYSPSKAAVLMLTKCIAAEYAPFVRANCIHPGLVETPMIQDRIAASENPDEFRTSMAEIYPLKRIGTTDDMAHAAVYLASNESSFVTGESIGVCGGTLI